VRGRARAPITILIAASLLAGAVAKRLPERAPAGPVETHGFLSGLAGLAVADLLWIRAAQDLPYGRKITRWESDRNYRRLRLSLALTPDRTARAEAGGLALAFWGRNDLACNLLHEAWTRRPTDRKVIVAYAVAQALRRMEDPWLAIGFLRQATANERAPAVAWKLLAWSYEQAGDTGAAMGTWAVVRDRYGDLDQRDLDLAIGEIERLRAGRAP